MPDKKLPFVTKFKLNYIWEMLNYLQFSFWISIAFANILFSLIFINRAQILLNSGGNSEMIQ